MSHSNAAEITVRTTTGADIPAIIDLVKARKLDI